MVKTPIYLDHHATTPVDPRVVEAMLPYFSEKFGNAGSTSHSFGWECRDAVQAARETLAKGLGARPSEIVFTSGATESNNLVIRGLADRKRRRSNHIVSVRTEHKSVLDPLTRLSHGDFQIDWLDVDPIDSVSAGRIDLNQASDVIRDDTLLVSVMLANNETGVLQPLEELAGICHERGVPLHTDATQAVGKIPLAIARLPIDLLSFSAHKFYGPKGMGALFVRRRGGPVRLLSQILGGGQEGGLRSGTLNVPGIVGMAAAWKLCFEEMDEEAVRVRRLRDLLFERLCEHIDGIELNGPALDRTDWRLGHNLNCSFRGVDGEALMMSMRDVAVSSGSACTSANPEPSHVLRAMGAAPDRVRSSLRFGLGRSTTEPEVEFAADAVTQTVARLRRLSLPEGG